MMSEVLKGYQQSAEYFLRLCIFVLAPAGKESIYSLMKGHRKDLGSIGCSEAAKHASIE